LKLGHHGSNTSNSKEFLDETMPEYVVICVGENSYNLPNKYVMERLQAYDQEHNKTAYANLKTTQNEGNITIDVSVVVNYGVRIPDVSWEVQENVKKSVELMSGLNVEKVNVIVAGVDFETVKEMTDDKTAQ